MPSGLKFIGTKVGVASSGRLVHNMQRNIGKNGRIRMKIYHGLIMYR